MKPQPPEYDPALEKAVHRQLKAMPSVKAPEMLMPRVLAAIQARANLPWWRRSWWHWPPWARVLLIAVGCALVASFTGGGYLLDRVMSGYAQHVTERLSPATGWWGGLAGLKAAGLSFYEVYFQSWMLYLAIGLALIYVSCLAAGTLAVRLVYTRS